MVSKNLLIGILVLFFGLPFLAITDLFPFHRFGMFARIPSNENSLIQYHVETHQPDSVWKILQTGNEYMDKSYIPLLARKAIHDPAEQRQLAEKLLKNLKEKPDSIRISGSAGEKSILIFP
jgi:hypothetical protein